ncbi:MAG: biotin transporter BioY [Bacilli bacterium]|nr:biotin transporter BioY [Bacilli bacterium]
MEDKNYELKKRRKIIKDIAFIPLFTSIIIICSWITVPFTVPFTLQTFAIFLSLLILGGKRGIIAIVLYVLLGLIGLPVFSGFKGGLASLIGPTGGFLIGFVFMGVVYFIFELTILNKRKNNNKLNDLYKYNLLYNVITLLVGLFVCYTLGTLWFSYVSDAFTISGFISKLMVAVLPFIIPDLLKLGIAMFIYVKIKKINTKR